jgi:hypothetical protein
MKKVRNYDFKDAFQRCYFNFLDAGSLQLKNCRNNLVVNGIGAQHPVIQI